MAESERLGQGEEEVVRREDSEGSIEGAPVPDLVRKNMVSIGINTGRILREFLMSLGWKKDEIAEFNKVVTLIGAAVEDGDYATALEAFETLKGDLRKLFANQQYEGAMIAAGNAVGVDKIIHLLSSGFEDFSAWILIQHTEVTPNLEASQNVAATADVILISANTSGATAEAAAVASGPNGRRRGVTTRVGARAAQA